MIFSDYNSLYDHIQTDWTSNDFVIDIFTGESFIAFYTHSNSTTRNSDNDSEGLQLGITPY